MKDGTWYYSDFDCWLAARDKFHYTKGGDNSVKAFKEAYKIMGISS